MDEEVRYKMAMEYWQEKAESNLITHQKDLKYVQKVAIILTIFAFFLGLSLGVVWE